MMLRPAHSSRILEITLLSAQDLAPLSQSMKAYAIVWVDPERKLSTGVDQTNFTDPQWNDKFVFRVDDKFLNSEDAAIEVEIYAAAWVKDALIGHVKVLIGDLFRLRSYPDTKAYDNSEMRVVSLHVRRPSGRPQGILNMGVALLDSTMRSLPLYAESSVCSAAYEEPAGMTDTEKESVKIWRSKSDRTDLTTDDFIRKWELGANTNGRQTPCNGGSMVNGESLCSDLGPSASIVAAAIAQGLYKPGEAAKGANSNPQKNNEINAEVERRRMELQPTTTMKKVGRRRGKGSKQRTAEEDEDDNGKFTCFGTMFGCEISISCGGGKRKKKHGKGKSNKVCHLSSIVDNYSQSYV